MNTRTSLARALALAILALCVPLAAWADYDYTFFGLRPAYVTADGVPVREFSLSGTVHADETSFDVRSTEGNYHLNSSPVSVHDGVASFYVEFYRLDYVDFTVSNHGVSFADTRQDHIVWAPMHLVTPLGLSVSAVPEPETYALLLAGLAALGLRRRRA